MAKTGGGSAYLKLQKPKDSVSPALQYWGGIKAKENAEELLAEEREGVRNEELRKWNLERYGVDPEDFKISEAGHKDLNSTNIAFSQELIDKKYQMSQEAIDLASKGDYKGAEELRGEMVKLESIFGNDMTLMDKHKENFNSYQLASEEGKVSGYSVGFENFYKAGLMEANLVKTIGKDGQIIYMTELVDEEGNKTNQVVSEQDALNGNFAWYKKQDLNKLSEDVMKTIGTIKIEKPDGGYSTLETTLWDNGEKGNKGIHSKALNLALSSKLGDVSFMSDMVDQMDLYEEFGIDEKNPQVNRKFSKEERDVVQKRLFDQFRANYDEVNKKTIDYTAINQAEGNKIAKDKDKEVEELVEADIMANTDGSVEQVLRYPTADGSGYREQSTSKYTLNSKSPIIGIFEDDKKAEILSISEASDGRFYAQKRVSTPKYAKTDPNLSISGEVGEDQTQPLKGESNTKTVEVELTFEELNRLAKKMGLANGGELSGYLSGRKKNYLESTGQSGGASRWNSEIVE